VPFEYTTALHLPDLYKPEPLHDFMYYATVHGGSRMVDFTIINTPVDTRNLRTSWYQKPVTVVHEQGGAAVYESGVATDVDYAPYVEHGTGLFGPHHRKYRIRAKGKAAGGSDYLRFVIGGKVIFAKQVWHPGSPGQHMVAISASMVEAQFDQIMRPILAEWANAQERGHGFQISGARFPRELGRHPG
jgi:hypothetical protein